MTTTQPASVLSPVNVCLTDWRACGVAPVPFVARLYFRLFSQLLQCLQWMYLHQSSAIPAAAQYLVVQLPELITNAERGSTSAAMTAFWAGLQQAIKPPLPTMLSFSKERLTLPTAGGNIFDQVS